MKTMNDPASGEERNIEARKKALRLLEFADRTEKQLRDKLLEGGFSEEETEDALEYARSFHYLDDRRYAENFVRARLGEKSLFEIRHMLRDRGVSPENIELVLMQSEEQEEGSDRETVERLFLKKYGRQDLSDPKVYERAFRYFSNRGFRYEDIRAALEAAIGRAEEDPFSEE